MMDVGYLPGKSSFLLHFFVFTLAVPVVHELSNHGGQFAGHIGISVDVRLCILCR